MKGRNALRRGRRHANRGLTLVELMVAMVIVNTPSPAVCLGKIRLQAYCFA